MISDCRFRHSIGAMVAVLAAALSIWMVASPPKASGFWNPYYEPKVTVNLGSGCKSSGFLVQPQISGGTPTKMTALLGLKLIANISAAPWEYQVKSQWLKPNRYYILTTITKFSSGVYFTNINTFKTCSYITSSRHRSSFSRHRSAHSRHRR